MPVECDLGGKLQVTQSLAARPGATECFLSSVCVCRLLSLMQTEPWRRGDRIIRKKLDRGLENQGNQRD